MKWKLPLLIFPSSTENHTKHKKHKKNIGTDFPQNWSSPHVLSYLGVLILRGRGLDWWPLGISVKMWFPQELRIPKKDIMHIAHYQSIVASEVMGDPTPHNCPSTPHQFRSLKNQTNIF